MSRPRNHTPEKTAHGRNGSSKPPRARINKQKDKPYQNPETPGSRFRVKLRGLLDRTGMGIDKFAASQGWDDWILSASALHAYIAGLKTPEIAALARLARAFDVSLAYLVYDDVDDPRAEAGPASLPEGERQLIEKGRRLGFERAAVVVETVLAMGYERFIAVVTSSASSVPRGHGDQ